MYPEIEAFAAHLAQVERASTHTRRAYVADLRQLAAFLGERGIALDAATRDDLRGVLDRKSTRLNSSHLVISYAVFCLKKKKIYQDPLIYSEPRVMVTR